MLLSPCSRQALLSVLDFPSFPVCSATGCGAAGLRAVCQQPVLDAGRRRRRRQQLAGPPPRAGAGVDRWLADADCWLAGADWAWICGWQDEPLPQQFSAAVGHAAGATTGRAAMKLQANVTWWGCHSKAGVTKGCCAAGRVCGSAASRNDREGVLWFLGQRTLCGEDRGSLVLCRKRQVWDGGLCGDMGLCRWQDAVPVMFSAFASYSNGCTSHTAGNRGVQEVLLCSFVGGADQ